MSPPAPCALSRLLDQRLDQGLELLAVDGIGRARRARGSGDSHGCTSDTIALVLLRTMLNVKVDKSDPTDLYEQVAGEIRRAIADGEAKPGERLPPAKDLAAVLDVNTNTVLRSLRLLRDEGLLEFDAAVASPLPGRPSAAPSSSEHESSSSSPAGRVIASTSWSRSSKTSADDPGRFSPVSFAAA